MAINRPLRKNIFREIRSTLGRFIAIFAISALGAGFYAGLKVTGPDMIATADQYYAQQNLADFRLLSTLGFTNEDVAAVRAVPGVDAVSPGYGLDILVEHPEGSEVARIISLPEKVDENDPAWLSRPVLEEGRWPAQAGECVIDSTSPHTIGEVVTLSGENPGSTLDLMAQSRFVVVGKVASPLYVAFQRGNTNIGSGKVSFFCYALPEAFDNGFYTELSLTVEKPAGLSSFSGEYQTLVDAGETRLEALAGPRARARYDELYAEGSAELADARKELADGKAEADQKLGEAWQEILDGEKEIADGWAEVETNRKKLADAQKTIADGEKQLEDGRVSLQAADASYADGLAQYQSGQAQYEAGLRQYQAGLAEYNQANAQAGALGTALPQLPGVLGVLSGLYGASGPATEADAQSYIDTATVVMQTAGGAAALLAASDDVAAQYAAGQINADIATASAALAAQPMPLWADANIALQDLANYHPAMEQALAGAVAELAAAKAQLDASKAELDAAAAELATAKATLDGAAAQIAAGKAELAEKQQELADGKAEVADGLRQLADAEAELADAGVKLADGKAEYEREKQKADDEMAEAEEKIADGEQQLADLGEGEWFVFPREDNPGYAGFSSDADRIDAIAVVIPVFFFLVAALVCLTSMTRMVEEQRTYIGTLKALGYHRRTIATKYIFYSMFASTSGALLGVAVGTVLFPAAIWSAYGMMYILPSISLGHSPAQMVISVVGCVGSTTLAALAACISELRSVPAQLMRPKPPKAGKRVLLERIGPLWRHMSFMQKVTVRNLFRYKKRFLMTVVGVAGCTALLLTGFGLRDSISGIVPRQYGSINLYDLIIALTEPSDASADTALNAGWPAYGDGLYLSETLVDVQAAGGSSTGMTVYFSVPQQPERFGEFTSLHQRKTGEAIPFPTGETVVITEKLAGRLNAEVGDVIEVSRLGEGPAQVTVAGVSENYLYNYVYATPELYSSLFGEAPEYGTLLFNLAENAPPAEDVISAFLGMAPVAGGMDVSAMEEQFGDMFDSLNAVIWLIIASAALLAFVVLYNLTNINITERTREIATLKVLGFRSGEVSAYVYRENIMLTLIGTAAGLVLGVFLHDFVIVTAEVDEVMFRRTVEPLSYLYSVLFTLLCGAVVNFVMKRRLNRIDMVESLKSIE